MMAVQPEEQAQLESLERELREAGVECHLPRPALVRIALVMASMGVRAKSAARQVLGERAVPAA